VTRLRILVLSVGTQVGHNVTTLAREFSNPLSAIHSSIQVLKRSSDSETTKPSLEILDRQIFRLIHLVDRLFDVTRLNKSTAERAKLAS
jgi:nitrogen-specific signal transduction histidine kinase